LWVCAREQEIAIQLEMFARTRRYLVANTETLLDRYTSGVWYFARQRERGALERFARDSGDDRVKVYPLPEGYDRWVPGDPVFHESFHAVLLECFRPTRQGPRRTSQCLQPPGQLRRWTSG
jgi:hypothetical protein